MTKVALKALINDLRLNHEYCPREIILEAADELEKLLLQPDLNALVHKVHKAKGRYHTQLAMCDLCDACGLPNIRPTSKD